MALLIRIFCLLVLLGITPFAFAGGMVQTNILVDTGPPADDCSGDLKFSWHMENIDVTLGTPAGCSDGDETGTLNSSASLSTTEKSDGTNSVKVEKSSGAGYYSFDVSSNDIIAMTEGKLTIDLFVDTYVDNAVFIKWKDSGCYAMIRMRNDGSDIEVQAYVDQGTAIDTLETSGSGHTVDEWLRIIYQWDHAQASGFDHKIELCDLTPPDTIGNCTSIQADTLVTWDNPITELQIGETQSVSGTLLFYTDNLQIYGDSGL